MKIIVILIHASELISLSPLGHLSYLGDLYNLRKLNLTHLTTPIILSTVII